MTLARRSAERRNTPSKSIASRVAPAVWYAGTPEPDRAGGQEQGTALLVEIAGRGAAALVSPILTGTYRWITRSERLDDEGALVDLDERLRSEPDLSRLILRLRIEGRLALAAHADFQRRMADLEAAVFHLDLDQGSLTARPTQADLERSMPVAKRKIIKMSI
jgi:hypothetical protein